MDGVSPSILLQVKKYLKEYVNQYSCYLVVMNDVKTKSLKCMKLQYLSVVGVVTLNVCPRAALTYAYRDWNFTVNFFSTYSRYCQCLLINDSWRVRLICVLFYQNF